MPAADIAPEKLQLAREIAHQLDVRREVESSVIPKAMEALRELFDADKSLAYRPTCVDGVGWTTDFVCWRGQARNSEAERTLDVFLAEHGGSRWAHYNPACPEGSQRNRVVQVTAPAYIDEGEASLVMRMLYPRLGLKHHHTLRVLICDGRFLLGWIGVFRSIRFTEGEQRLLGLLNTALRRRLRWERMLLRCRLAEVTLAAALESLPTAAFVINAAGQLLHANELGKPAWNEAKAAVRRTMRITGREAAVGGYEVTTISTTGAPCYLLVRSVTGSALEAKLAQAAKCWLLTARQTEVLRLAAEGDANKDIAVKLGCTGKTVEAHISAILRKAQVESRMHLLSRLWTISST